MTTADKVIKTTGFIELGKQLGDMTQACPVMGHSGRQFLSIKDFTTEAERQRCKRSREARNVRNRLPRD